MRLQNVPRQTRLLPLKTDHAGIPTNNLGTLQREEAIYWDILITSWSFTILLRFSPLLWSTLYSCKQDKCPGARYLMGTNMPLSCLRNLSDLLNKQNIWLCPLKTALWEQSGNLAATLVLSFLILFHNSIDLGILLCRLTEESAEDCCWDGALLQLCQ